jgi:hypothetical protein
MDVLTTVATMDSAGTLAATAPDCPIATTTTPMETASLADSKRAATSGWEAKPKVPKKLMSMEEKGVQAVKRHGRRKNLKDRKGAAAAAQ